MVWPRGWAGPIKIQLSFGPWSGHKYGFLQQEASGGCLCWNCHDFSIYSLIASGNELILFEVFFFNSTHLLKMWRTRVVTAGDKIL